jgi:hypothetical protein
MKRATILLFAALTLVLAACTNSFTPAAIGADKSAAEATALVTANAITNAVSIALSGSGLTNGATTKGTLTITFNNATITSTTDLTNLASALAVYPVTNGTTATSAYTRGTAVTLLMPVVSVSGSSTTVAYSLDMSGYSATTGSRVWEVFIAGDKLTSGGVKILDLNNDNVVGVAGDDDYIGYQVLTNGVYPTVGAARLPQATIGYSTSINATATTSTLTFSDYLYDYAGGYLSIVTPTLTASSITGLVALQYYDTTSGWQSLTTTNTYNATTGVLTLTRAAFANGSCYRFAITTPATIVETTKVCDYAHRASSGSPSIIYMGEFANGSNPKQSSATYTATANFDSKGQNGWIQLDFSNLGTAGILLSSMTTDNVKLYDYTNLSYIPIISSFTLIGTTNANSASVKLSLPATYTRTGHSFDVYIGPSVTANNLNLGNWMNVPTAASSFFPYLFQRTLWTSGNI